MDRKFAKEVESSGKEGVMLEDTKGKLGLDLIGLKGLEFTNPIPFANLENSNLTTGEKPNPETPPPILKMKDLLGGAAGGGAPGIDGSDLSKTRGYFEGSNYNAQNISELLKSGDPDNLTKNEDNGN